MEEVEEEKRVEEEEEEDDKMPWRKAGRFMREKKGKLNIKGIFLE